METYTVHKSFQFSECGSLDVTLPIINIVILCCFLCIYRQLDENYYCTKFIEQYRLGSQVLKPILCVKVNIIR